MKSKFSLLLLTCAIAFGLCSKGLGELVAHWPLDNDASDRTGNHDGTPHESITFGAAGQFGGSATFTGSGGIAVPWSEALNPADNFSITAWVNPTNTTDWNSPITSRAHAGDPVQVTGYILYNTPNNEWDFWVGTGGPSGAWGRSIGPEATVNEWQHLAITYDGATDTKTLYVNGEVGATDTGQGFAPNPQNQLTIGAGDDVGTNFFFHGQMDDVAMFNTTLSQGQIQSIMANGVPEPASITLLFLGALSMLGLRQRR